MGSKFNQITDDFSSELTASGLYPETIIADGVIHKCKVEGDASDEQNGWYILAGDSGIGSFGNLRTRSTQTWQEISASNNFVKSNLDEIKKQKEARDIPKNLIDNKISLQRCSDIEPQPISWMWPNWLPSGKLTVLAGGGGVSKSTLSLAIAAIISRGSYWPDGTACSTRGNVLIWSSEDSASDVIVPRLIAAGADLERCLILGEVNQNEKRRSFDPSQDVDKLENAVKYLGGVRLIIIDPIVSAVSGDMHRANDVRRSLQSIVDFSQTHNCAVIGISHVAKGSAGKTPYDRVIGSQAFTALARVVLMAAKEEDGDRRILAIAKSNIGPDNGGIEYFLHETSYCSLGRKEIKTSYINWGQSLHGSARELLSQVEVNDNDQERGSRSELKRVISLAIRNAGGEILVKTLEQEVKAAGLSFYAAKRVKDELNISSEKLGMTGPWVWRLPNSQLADS